MPALSFQAGVIAAAGGVSLDHITIPQIPKNQYINVTVPTVSLNVTVPSVALNVSAEVDAYLNRAMNITVPASKTSINTPRDLTSNNTHVAAAPGLQKRFLNITIPAISLNASAEAEVEVHLNNTLDVSASASASVAGIDISIHARDSEPADILALPALSTLITSINPTATAALDAALVTSVLHPYLQTATAVPKFVAESEELAKLLCADGGCVADFVK